MRFWCGRAWFRLAISGALRSCGARIWIVGFCLLCLKTQREPSPPTHTTPCCVMVLLRCAWHGGFVLLMVRSSRRRRRRGSRIQWFDQWFRILVSNVSVVAASWACLCCDLRCSFMPLLLFCGLWVVVEVLAWRALRCALYVLCSMSPCRILNKIPVPDSSQNPRPGF